MKALALNSSNRKNGNTGIALHAFGNKLEGLGYDVEYVDLGALNLQLCRGCRQCFDSGEACCPLRDDVLSLHRKMLGFDLIVWGSPVYVEDVNGVMKNLIDRLAFNCHRPAYFNSRAYILCTSGSGSSSHSIKTIKRALMTWGFEVVGSARFVTGARISETAFKARYARRLTRDSTVVDKALRRRSKPGFLSLLAFAIQQRFYRRRGEPGTVDYEYWRSRGWLDFKCRYYTREGHAGPKRLLAEVCGVIVTGILLR